MRRWSQTARATGSRIGLVPTMGALHAGHLSLIETLRGDVDQLVMSIFVNPLQFGPTEDLDDYPRTLDRDERLASGSGVDVVFVPASDAMYQDSSPVTVSPGSLGDIWEGAHRPGHFSGVLTVVAKLLHLVDPALAVFGRKDYQQVQCIRRMVRHLDFGVSIRIGATVREGDGLAMSSRNAYLSVGDRPGALALSGALRRMERDWRSGERLASVLLDAGRRVLKGHSSVEVDYIALVDPETMASVHEAGHDTVAIVAARVGSTRLIDNVILGEGFAADPTAPL